MMVEKQTGMQFHVTVSRDTNVEKAGRAVGNAVKEAFGESPVDLAFVFFSTHYAEDAQRLVKAIRHEVPIQVLLGCMGEGVIGASEEFEGTAVVTLWAACLPKVHVFPMPTTPSSHPLITRPAPNRKEKGSFRSTELSNFVPSSSQPV